MKKQLRRSPFYINIKESESRNDPWYYNWIMITIFAAIIVLFYKFYTLPPITIQ